MSPIIHQATKGEHAGSPLQGRAQRNIQPMSRHEAPNGTRRGGPMCPPSSRQARTRRRHLGIVPVRATADEHNLFSRMRRLATKGEHAGSPLQGRAQRNIQPMSRHEAPHSTRRDGFLTRPQHHTLPDHAEEQETNSS